MLAAIPSCRHMSHVRRGLRPGHPLLSGEYRRRDRCAGCDHTFRPFDRVAFCPCNPSAPACRLAAPGSVPLRQSGFPSPPSGRL